MQHQFDGTPCGALALALTMRPNFAPIDPGLMAALAALPTQARQGLAKLGKMRQQRGALAVWLRTATDLVNEGTDSGELSRSERATWSRRLHRRLGDLKALDRNVVDLQTALLESV